MAYGLLLRLRHTGTTTSSILLTDTEDNSSANPLQRRGARYVHVSPTGGTGPAVDLVFTDSVAQSYESGAIRTHINAGRITAQFLPGTEFTTLINGLVSPAKMERIPVLIAPGQVLVESVWATEEWEISGIEAMIKTPAVTAGVYTLSVSGAGNNLLSAVSFDLTTLAANTPLSIPLTGTAAHLTIPVGGVIDFTFTSDNIDLTASGLAIQMIYT